MRVTDLCAGRDRRGGAGNTGAFLQLYREEAHYLERTAPWVERVGIDYVRKRLVEDAAGRRALFMRAFWMPRASCRTTLGRARERRRRP